MTINERFERIINALYNGNKRAFATSIGVSATVVENVVGKRQGKPSYDVLVAVCACANISAHWLLTGEGDMLRGEGDEEIKRGGDDSLDGRLSSIIDVLREENKRLQDDNRELNREIGRLEVRLEQALSNKE